MKESLLITALRRRDPRALGAVHDAYAERLYLYCWSQLHSLGAAALALRDTLMWAEARVHELPPGARLAPWLYRIARAECARRALPGCVRPDVPSARHDQDDVVARVVAWHAVARLPPLSRELLDLRYRHGLTPGDIGTVIGAPAGDVVRLLGRGRELLEAALAWEILAGAGPFECAARRILLRRGEDLLRHTRECDDCGRRVPRSVSVAKVYGLLPRPAPPRYSRSQVMRSLTDPALAQYRLLVVLRGYAPRRGTSGRPAARAAAAALLAAAVTAIPWLAPLDGGAHRRDPAPRPALDARPVIAPRPASRPFARPAGLE